MLKRNLYKSVLLTKQMKKEETAQHFAHSQDNSFGVASVVLGIIAIVLASVIGIIFAVIGLIFGIKQSKIAKNKWSSWGIILAIIAIILSIIVVIFNLWFAESLLSNLS